MFIKTCQRARYIKTCQNTNDSGDQHMELLNKICIYMILISSNILKKNGLANFCNHIKNITDPIKQGFGFCLYPCQRSDLKLLDFLKESHLQFLNKGWKTCVL